MADHLIRETIMSFLFNDPLPQPHQTGERSAEDCASHGLPAAAPAGPAHDTSTAPGRVQLDADLLRRLRQARFMSQQDLADDCWRRNIQLSLSTIKRAELGRAVRFRIVREFARCFDVSTVRIASSENPASTLCNLPVTG
jgi:hypothetical protein